MEHDQLTNRSTSVQIWCMQYNIQTFLNITLQIWHMQGNTIDIWLPHACFCNNYVIHPPGVVKLLDSRMQGV